MGQLPLGCSSCVGAVADGAYPQKGPLSAFSCIPSRHTGAGLQWGSSMNILIHGEHASSLMRDLYRMQASKCSLLLESISWLVKDIHIHHHASNSQPRSTLAWALDVHATIDPNQTPSVASCAPFQHDAVLAPSHQCTGQCHMRGTSSCCLTSVAACCHHRSVAAILLSEC